LTDPVPIVERRSVQDRRTASRGGRRMTDPCLKTAVDTLLLDVSEQVDEVIHANRVIAAGDRAALVERLRAMLTRAELPHGMLTAMDGLLHDAHRAHEDLSYRRVQDLTGLPKKTLQDLLKGVGDPQLSTLVRLARPFGFCVEVSFRPKRRTT
jgi:hypothetical protein